MIVYFIYRGILGRNKTTVQLQKTGSIYVAKAEAVEED